LPAHRLADRSSAAHGAGGSVEDSKEPVAQALDLTPAKPGELSARHMCVLLPNETPTVIAHRRRLRGRVDDVGEQDRREDAIEGLLFVAANRAYEPLDLGDQRVLVPRPGEVVCAG
jgi:hypothetical protein